MCINFSNLSPFCCRDSWLRWVTVTCSGPVKVLSSLCPLFVWGMTLLQVVSTKGWNVAFLEHFRMRYALGLFPVILHTWLKPQTDLFCNTVRSNSWAWCCWSAFPLDMSTTAPSPPVPVLSPALNSKVTEGLGNLACFRPCRNAFPSSPSFPCSWFSWHAEQNEMQRSTEPFSGHQCCRGSLGPPPPRYNVVVNCAALWVGKPERYNLG